MDDYLELIKVESALRSEYMKLEYRQIHKPKEVNILDYTVIAALEKQIPQEVVQNNDNFNSWYECNKCHCIVSEMADRYCPACGQKLKYSEE